MCSTRIEFHGPTACTVAKTTDGPGRRALRKRGMRRRLFLRRAAVGIAGTGWAFFGAPGMGDGAGLRQSARSAVALDVALEDGSLRSTGLPGFAPDLIPVPLADPAAPGRNYQLRIRADDGTAGQFVADVRERLPRFQTSFEQAGQRNGLDWRLLAAMGYQESSWNPRAVSPTGVRGIMMLTLDTADELEVDRDNPAESIQGGALYFEQILERLPSQIHEPDRTDMALAAYNQGVGHLLDARILAAQAGGSPNRWRDVQAALPLLSDEHWFSQTRHGYARGQEAVSFVRRVRSYYGMLSSIAPDDSRPTVEVASNRM